MFLEHILLKHSEVPVTYARRLELVSHYNDIRITYVTYKLGP